MSYSLYLPSAVLVPKLTSKSFHSYVWRMFPSRLSPMKRCRELKYQPLVVSLISGTLSVPRSLLKKKHVPFFVPSFRNVMLSILWAPSVIQCFQNIKFSNMFLALKMWHCCTRVVHKLNDEKWTNKQVDNFALKFEIFWCFKIHNLQDCSALTGTGNNVLWCFSLECCRTFKIESAINAVELLK